MAKKRAMDPETAREKKLRGHKVEHEFAGLIRGQINAGSQTDKKDVIDQQHCWHSVKSGKYWQIFLYRRSRLETNTIFQGMGKIAPLMIACLDAFPDSRSDYLNSKSKYKIALQSPMKNLATELREPYMLSAFLAKALFNGGEVNYLSVKTMDSVFHVFHQSDVVSTLTYHLDITNSAARHNGQFDAQKTLLKYNNKNIGEIEVRNDSAQHYREIKCRFVAERIFALLQKKIQSRQNKTDKLIAYGKAIRKFNYQPEI